MTVVPLHNGNRWEQELGLDIASHPVLGRVEIANVREGGLIDASVPAKMVDHEDVAFRQDHAEEIARNMRRQAQRNGGIGQDSPILFGLIEDATLLKVIDGFHRNAALSILEAPVRDGTIKITTQEGLYDDRIFTSKEHPQVRFSRVVQWIREVWSINELSRVTTVNGEPFSVTQAVLLYRYDSSGIKLGLEPDVVKEAKSWVARKEEQWELKAMTIHSHLKVAENVDPDLVHSTRDRKGGNALEAPTREIIKIFSKELPSDFGLQNLVMETAMANNLRGPQVRSLCRAVQNCRDLEDAKTLIAGFDWENWQPTYGETKTRHLRKAYDARRMGANVFVRPAADIGNVLLRAHQSFERGEEVTPEMANNILDAMVRAEKLKAELSDVIIRLAELAGIDTIVQPASSRADKPVDLVPEIMEKDAPASSAIVELLEEDLEDELGADGSEIDSLGEVSDDEQKKSIVTEPTDDSYVIEDTDSDEGLWDDDLSEETTIDEDDTEDTHTPQTRSDTIMEKILEGLPSSRAQKAVELKNFLDGLSPGYVPELTTRLEISLAEKILAIRTFAGSPILADDLRDEINRARNEIALK